MKPLRQHRRERLISLERLAAQAGVTAKTLSNIERGKQRPGFRSMRGISQALDLDPREITEFNSVLQDLPDDGES